jgi:hypothetical protein
MRCVVLAAMLSLAAPAFAGFASTESFLPAVGRIPGKFGAQFYTTIWATNLTGATVHFKFEFLKQGQANTSPASFADTLAAGQTKVYENVVETKLGLNNDLGAARVTADGEVLVAERIYNQNPGDDLDKTEGLFFAGVPKGFSISLGQSASIQGIDQGGAEDFRYNFALVETGGASTTVHVVLYDGSGAQLGAKDYTLHPYEQIQPNVDDLAANLATTNARITATVTAGAGSVLLAGAQLANVSQDSSGFEMSFRDTLLGGGGGSGVTSLNSLTGALTLTPGSGISITPSGSSIQIAYTGGGGSGITSVTHDASLAGAGTGGSPLAIANGQVVRSLNGLRDAVTLSAGSNVTITPSGQTLTIAASGGGGGGLTLPFTGSASAPGAGVFSIQNSASTGVGVQGTGSAAGIAGSSQTGAGVAGSTADGAGPGVDGGSTIFDAIGVRGRSSTVGVFGALDNSPPVASAGVEGMAQTANGVYGQSDSADAVYGLSNSASGVKGHGNGHGAGIYGENSSTNASTGGHPGSGVYGYAGDGPGVVGQSANNYGVEGDAGQANKAGVYGTNSSSGTGVTGYSHNGYGVYGFSDTSDAGYFGGNVTVAGNLTKGSGSFKIDHPLDPADKYLYHSFVESPDMKNIYDGVATLDESGNAVVSLPDWFEALNRDFRYQLTSIGTPQPGLYIAREVENNAFAISGGTAGARVSWQVTGIRHDAYADAHRIPIEEGKKPEERGRYLHPELFGHAGEAPIGAPRAAAEDQR